MDEINEYMNEFIDINKYLDNNEIYTDETNIYNSNVIINYDEV